MSLQIEHVPPGPVAQAFHDSNAFVRALVGPVGSGKSVCGYVEILRRFAARTPDSDGVVRARAAVIRNQFGMLRSATLPTIFKWHPEGLGRITVGTSPMVIDLKLPKIHLHIDLLALDQEDDVRKLLSTEYHYVWIDEGREIVWGIMQTLVGRVGRQPAEDRRFAGIWITSNPSPVEHWLCKKFTTEKIPGWDLFLQPGGLSPGAENLHAIGGRPYYDRIVAASDVDFQKVFVAAEWGYTRIGEPVFAMFSDSIHTSKAPLEPIPGAPLVLGLDFGLSPACVWIQQDSSGRYLVLDELTSEEAPGIAHFSELIRQRTMQKYPDNPVAFGVYDPAGAQRSPLSDKTQSDILKSVSGYRWIPSASNLFSHRREALIAPLSRLVEGKPGILISPTCTILREALSGKFCFRQVRNAAGIQVMEGEPLKSHPWSDVADALCYGLLGAGEHLSLVQLGRKRLRRSAGIWNPRIGRFCDETGRPIEDRGRMARDVDFPLFGDHGERQDRGR